METVVNIRGQETVAAMLILVPLQILMHLVDQECHSLKGCTAQVNCAGVGGQKEFRKCDKM